MNVQIVKLISGEELIGEFDDSTNIITSPVVMIPVDNQKIAFSPWMPYAENKEFILKENIIMTIAQPSKLIANEWNKAFGSGLISL